MNEIKIKTNDVKSINCDHPIDNPEDEQIIIGLNNGHTINITLKSYSLLFKGEYLIIEYHGV